MTLTGEARLWYESLRPINTDWVGLQNMFSQQYSKIGNTREQLFDVWRSFHFDENAETVNLDKRKDRQTVGRTDFLDSIYKHKIRVWLEGYIQNDR